MSVPEEGEENPGNVAEVEKDRVELWLDDYFEPFFFKLRYFLMVPVLVSFVGAMVMFGVGSYETGVALFEFVGGHFGGKGVTVPLIKALDAYLIGIILTIFSFGVYDFFVSELEPAEEAGVRPDWLKFESVGELKNKIIEVVLVILTIVFFEQMRANAEVFDTTEEFLIIPVGTAILAVSLGAFKYLTE